MTVTSGSRIDFDWGALRLPSSGIACPGPARGNSDALRFKALSTRRWWPLRRRPLVTAHGVKFRLGVDCCHCQQVGWAGPPEISRHSCPLPQKIFVIEIRYFTESNRCFHPQCQASQTVSIALSAEQPLPHFQVAKQKKHRMRSKRLF